MPNPIPDMHILMLWHFNAICRQEAQPAALSELIPRTIFLLPIVSLFPWICRNRFSSAHCYDLPSGSMGRRHYQKQTTAIFSLFVHFVATLFVKWRGIKACCSCKHQLPLYHVSWGICICSRNKQSGFLLFLDPWQWREKPPLVQFTSN